MSSEYLQLGAIGIIFIFFLKEFFSYLKSRKNGNGKQDSKQNISLAVLDTKLKAIETNHLPTIIKRLDRIDEKIDKIYDLLIKK